MQWKGLPHMSAVEVVTLSMLGFGVGVFGTLIGAGGGFLAVPLLIILYHVDSNVAAGTSLLFVFFNALSGSIAYLRQKKVDVKIGLIFTLMTVPGSIAGAYITTYYLESFIFKILFSLILFSASLYLLLRPVEEQKKNPTGKGYRRILVDSRGNAYQYNVSLPVGLIISFGVGFISSIFGIGGGIVHVPAMIFLLNFPVHIATATSQFILCFSTLVGSITHYALGNIRFDLAIPMAAGALVGAQLGAKLSLRTKGTIIERLLSIGLILVAVRLIIQAFE
jgi:uncharacterized membrane protein YfcA